MHCKFSLGLTTTPELCPFCPKMQTCWKVEREVQLFRCPWTTYCAVSFKRVSGYANWVVWCPDHCKLACCCALIPTLAHMQRPLSHLSPCLENDTTLLIWHKIRMVDTTPALVPSYACRHFLFLVTFLNGDQSPSLASCLSSTLAA